MAGAPAAPAPAPAPAPAAASSGSESADALSSHGNTTEPYQRSLKERSQRQAPGTAADGPAGNRSVEQVKGKSKGKDKDEADSDKEFAKQMLGVKAGHSLVRTESDRGRQRPAGMSHANSSAKHLAVSAAPPNATNDSSSHNPSATSSTTGGDADDDLSPAVSPRLGATTATTAGQHVSGGDVSDMLEAPAAGPSVLRITESTRPQVPGRPQSSRTVTAQETKKQRQNRRKAEEKKAARADAEVDRRALLEKQLRTAREAEGRPAKNGLGSLAAAAPKSSVWSDSGPRGANGASAAHKAGIEQKPLLDTFGRADAAPAESAFGGASVDSTGTQSSSSSAAVWDRQLPSEEDQMRMIQEMEGWNTVAKGRKGRKNSGNNDNNNRTGPDTSESEARADESVGTNGSNNPAAAAAAPQQSQAGAHGAGSFGPSSSNDYTGTNGRIGFAHPAESDWAVV